MTDITFFHFQIPKFSNKKNNLVLISLFFLGLIKWSSEMKEKYNAEQINLEYNMRNTEKLARVSSFVGKSPDDLSTQISRSAHI